MLAQTKTLAECQELAVQNYPLIKKYDLIAQTTATETDNVAKQWLPKISAYAQATLQSDVVTLPETMNNLLKITGVAWEGLKRDQYKIGIDVNQIIYDGGAIKSQKHHSATKRLASSAKRCEYLCGKETCKRNFLLHSPCQRNDKIKR